MKKENSKLKNKLVMGAVGCAIMCALSGGSMLDPNGLHNTAHAWEEGQSYNIKEYTHTEKEQIATAQSFFDKHASLLAGAVTNVFNINSDDVTEKMKEDFSYRVEQEIVAGGKSYHYTHQPTDKLTAQEKILHALKGYNAYEEVIVGSAKYINMFYTITQEKDTSNLTALTDNQLKEQLQLNFEKAVVLKALEQEKENKEERVK